MTISEKVAYIKGLAEMAECDDKITKAIIDVLEDIASTVNEISEQVDAVDEDLSYLEEDFYGEEECDGDCEGCLDEDCEFFDDDDDFCYEVECPTCHDIIYLDEEMVEEGGIKCPNCKEDLEFDFDDIEEEKEDK